MEEVEEDDEFELDEEEVQEEDLHGQEWWPGNCGEPVPAQGGESLALEVDLAWKKSKVLASIDK